MKDKRKVSRREFLGTSVTAVAGFTILPSNTIAGMGHKAPSDKLNIAIIGTGGRGGNGGQSDFLNYIMSLKNYETTVNTSGNGVSVSYKKAEK